MPTTVCIRDILDYFPISWEVLCLSLLLVCLLPKRQFTDLSEPVTPRYTVKPV